MGFSFFANAEQPKTSIFKCDKSALKSEGFKNLPYIVKTESNFYSVPDLKNAKFKKSTTLSKLIPGDLVQLASDFNTAKVVNNFGCVYYQNIKGHFEIGWVEISNLVEVEDDNEIGIISIVEKRPAQNWFPRSAHQFNYPGKFFDSKLKKNWLILKDLGTSGGKLLPNDAITEVDQGGEKGYYEMKLIKPRELNFTEFYEGKPAISVNAFLLNNAIYLHVKDHITSQNHWGIYYP